MISLNILPKPFRHLVQIPFDLFSASKTITTDDPSKAGNILISNISLEIFRSIESLKSPKLPLTTKELKKHFQKCKSCLVSNLNNLPRIWIHTALKVSILALTWNYTSSKITPFASSLLNMNLPAMIATVALPILFPSSLSTYFSYGFLSSGFSYLRCATHLALSSEKTATMMIGGLPLSISRPEIFATMTIGVVLLGISHQLFELTDETTFPSLFNHSRDLLNKYILTPLTEKLSPKKLVAS